MLQKVKQKMCVFINQSESFIQPGIRTNMSDSAMFLATLVEMGFDQGISKVALSKTGSKSVQVCLGCSKFSPIFQKFSIAHVEVA